jgi:hypothetical protein
VLRCQFTALARTHPRMQAACPQAAVVAARGLQAGEEVRMRLVYDSRSRQPRIQYLPTGRRGGRGGAQPSAPPARAEGPAAEAAPQVDEEGLLALVRLLRLGQVSVCGCAGGGGGGGH